MVLDTNAYVAFKRGEPAAVAHFALVEGLSVITRLN